MTTSKLGLTPAPPPSNDGWKATAGMTILSVGGAADAGQYLATTLVSPIGGFVRAAYDFAGSDYILGPVLQFSVASQHGSAIRADRFFHDASTTGACDCLPAGAAAQIKQQSAHWIRYAVQAGGEVGYEYDFAMPVTVTGRVLLGIQIADPITSSRELTPNDPTLTRETFVTDVHSAQVFFAGAAQVSGAVGFWHSGGGVVDLAVDVGTDLASHFLGESQSSTNLSMHVGFYQRF